MRAKREAPAPVAPVTVDGVRYEVLHYAKMHGYDHNGGYILAKDAATGKLLRAIEVYEFSLDPKGKELDGQEVFITRMRKSWFGRRLNVRDEQGRSWTVDLVDPAAAP